MHPSHARFLSSWTSPPLLSLHSSWPDVSSHASSLAAEEMEKDWWGGVGHTRPMRYETQADLLRLLSSLSQHYAAVSLSLTVTRSFDATRLCTLGAIAAVRAQRPCLARLTSSSSSTTHSSTHSLTHTHTSTPLVSLS